MSEFASAKASKFWQPGYGAFTTLSLMLFCCFLNLLDKLVHFGFVLLFGHLLRKFADGMDNKSLHKQENDEAHQQRRAEANPDDHPFDPVDLGVQEDRRSCLDELF